MATVTMKNLREQAETLIEGGVGNREALYQALPVLVDLQDKMALARRNLEACRKAAAQLSELCSAYVLDHESVFDNKHLVLSQQKVLTGDITLENQVFHFAHGYDGYERLQPTDKMTQGFLATLPEDWRSSHLKIDVSAINDAQPSDEELEHYGLRQKAKNEWSEVQAA